MPPIKKTKTTSVKSSAKTTAKKKAVPKISVIEESEAITSDVADLKPTEPIYKAKKFTPKMKESLEKEIEEFELATEGLDTEEDIPATKRIEETDIKENEVPEPTAPLNHHIGMYKKIAFAFIFLTLILVGLVFYFSFVKLTVSITPKEEEVSDTLVLDIYDFEKFETAENDALLGVVDKTDLELTQSFKSTGEDIIGEEVAGKVKILNTTSFAQPLVATTRLLSPDGKLFRLKETVNVPANGEVEVEIYADVPGKDMAIEPTKFTIPGLRADKQDDIYAVSENPFIYSNKVNYFIKQADIDEAAQNIKTNLLQKAEADFGDEYLGYSKAIYNLDENSINVKVDGKVGDEVDEFNLTIKANIEVVAFDLKDVAAKAYNRLVAGLPDNKELVNFDPEKINFELTDYDLAEGRAIINVYFSGLSSLRDGASLINKEKIVGLSTEQLKDYLDSFPEIESYQISFSPSFIKKVPKLVDRITIVIRSN